MGKIKPTLTLTANANTATTDAGPLSVALSLSAPSTLTVDTVNSKIVTVTTTSTLLYDGSGMSGTDTATEGAGGTYGGYIYLKNITKSGSGLIYIGIDHDGGSGEIQADDQADDFTGATRLFTLKLGEFVWLPFDYTMDIFCDASANGTGDTIPKLECWHFNRSTS
jgi:hypothetical protein